jgi:Fe-S cluster biosynthesis and repair protein YggX
MRKVFCKKFQKEMEGLEKPPYPGPRGQDIFENVSNQAWQDWLSHQTMLINENELNLMEPSTKTFLDEQFQLYLEGENYERPKGYVPPSK